MKSALEEAHEDLAYIKKALQDYEEGTLTASEVPSLIFDRHLKRLVEIIKSGEPLIYVGSHCGPVMPRVRSQIQVVFHLIDGEIREIGPVGWDPEEMYRSWSGPE